MSINCGTCLRLLRSRKQVLECAFKLNVFSIGIVQVRFAIWVSMANGAKCQTDRVCP
jgi:hypothetical protein